MLSHHTVKMIDFGLACPASPPPSQSAGLIGSARYAARGHHMGRSTRQDDLESMAYVVAYLALGTLPWQALDVPSSDRWLPLFSYKDRPVPELFPVPPGPLPARLWWTAFGHLLGLVREAEPNEPPPYDLIEFKLQEMLAYAGGGFCFDWCPGGCRRGLTAAVWAIGHYEE
jgi:serine/threonine protein kinase